jgi:hydroxyacylglutathione hydrolase
MRIVLVPCLKDNYAYLAICEATGTAAVVDPSEAGPVLDAVGREKVSLQTIWNTHHHWDHTGGNKKLLEALPELEVVAHSSDKGRIPGQTTFVDHDDQVTLGEELCATIIHNPGHTTGAISFYLDQYGVVFTGDTLFCAGCGRLFEGTPSQMHASLARLAELPESTRIYCGHEYTAANLRFAAAVEPNNQAIKERAAQVRAQRNRGEPTVPGTLADELATNPFLRVSQPPVIEAARARAGRQRSADSPAEVFATLRHWKDSF